MVRKPYAAVPLPIWHELLVGIEMVYLRLSPVYWGFGIPRGDGSAVIVIPAFLMTDLYLTEFRAWINRIGYKAYFSGIGRNTECPNLLIQHKLNATHTEGLQANRQEGSPGGTQPGRRARARGGIPNAGPHCVGDYAGIAVSRRFGAPFGAARRRTGARAYSRASRQGCVAGVLHLTSVPATFCSPWSPNCRNPSPRRLFLRSRMESWIGGSAGPATPASISKSPLLTSVWRFNPIYR